MAIEPFLGTAAQKGFIATIIIQAIAVLTMVAISFGIVDEYVSLSQGDNRTIPCYFALFALGELFEIAIALDALRLRNIIQLIGVCLFHAGMIVFSALQVPQTRTALVKAPGADCAFDYAHCSGPGSLFNRVEPFLIVSPVLLAVSLVVLVWFTWQLYHEFGWVVFHIVGANPRMKVMYQYYQVLICLLKFDYFFFTALTMQLLILVLSRDGAEFPLTIIAIPVVLILLTFCAVAVQREIKWLMTVSLVLMLGAQAYFLYKFSRLFTAGWREAYGTTRASLAVFTIVSFLMLFATFAVGLRCFADFDKDLRPAKTRASKLAPERPVSKYSVNDAPLPGKPADMTQRNSSYNGGVPLGPRMSIE
ncbi:hypothetical protein FRC01_001760 [Tulasnella sp. 417]|nr:hypothetical protein FRC01_001760 [Tulasnella sp. 417]